MCGGVSEICFSLYIFFLRVRICVFVCGHHVVTCLTQELRCRRILISTACLKKSGVGFTISTILPGTECYFGGRVVWEVFIHE